MKRYSYREPIPQCQALTNKKQRCSRDATAIHAGKGYCSTHHQKKLEEKNNERKTNA